MNRLELRDICSKLFEKNCTGEIEYVAIEENERLSVCGLDSFAYVMIYMELATLFEIGNDAFTEKLPKGDVVLKDLLDFLEQNATKEPTLEEIKDACN